MGKILNLVFNLETVLAALLHFMCDIFFSLEVYVIFLRKVLELCLLEPLPRHHIPSYKMIPYVSTYSALYRTLCWFCSLRIPLILSWIQMTHSGQIFYKDLSPIHEQESHSLVLCQRPCC